MVSCEGEPMIDRRTSVEEIKRKVRIFVKERDWEKYHTPKNLAESICIEATELLQIFQWKKEDDVKTRKFSTELKKKIAEELADILIYSLSLANTTKIDVSTAISKKIKINEKKYPVEKWKGKAWG